MNTPIIFLCCIVGHIAGYNVQREVPYNTGPIDPYYYNQNSYEPSQRLFWGNNGSNQVGGTGLWSTLTNKFPFLNNMFGKMQLGPEYRSVEISPQYGIPDRFQQQYFQPQYRQNGPSARDVGLTDDAVIITPPDVPIAPESPTRPEAPQFPTRPQFPTAPQFPSAPQYPTVPQPAPPSSGYQYNKPLYRLELPHK